MRSMLLAAQKMAASMTEEAKTKSEQLLSDAQQESRRLLEEAKNSAEVINRDLAWKTKDAREKYEQAKAAMEDFVAKNLALCLQQAEYLEKLPHSQLSAPEEPAAAPAEVPAEEPVSVSEPAPAAEPAATASYGEVARMVSATKDQNPANLPNGVSRLVKRAGADATLKNAIRDGAEWAWVPHGDTCPFCITLASNGWQKASQKLLKGGHA